MQRISAKRFGQTSAGLRWLVTEIYNDRELARRRRHYMDIAKRNITRGEPRTAAA